MEESKSVQSLSHKERTTLVKEYYVKRGYRVHSGLQFGCELVLYADMPSRVHSDFCVHIPDATRLSWMAIQVLVRSMPDLHKTLIVATLKDCPSDHPDAVCFTRNNSVNEPGGAQSDGKKYFIVDEIAIGSEHAPFRHKNVSKEVGFQRKKQKT